MQQVFQNYFDPQFYESVFQFKRVDKNTIHTISVGYRIWSNSGIKEEIFYFEFRTVTWGKELVRKGAKKVDGVLTTCNLRLKNQKVGQYYEELTIQNKLHCLVRLVFELVGHLFQFYASDDWE